MLIKKKAILLLAKINSGLVFFKKSRTLNQIVRSKTNNAYDERFSFFSLPLIPISRAKLGKWEKGKKGKESSFILMSMDKDGSFDKSFYTSYTKLTEIKLITIGLASPERIRRWAEKTLPNGKVIGQVTNANTLHHKTFKPQKGGLFCERIFGPLKDFECACGKTQKPLSLLKSEGLSEKKK